MQIRRESIVRAPAARVWRILGEEFMSVGRWAAPITSSCAVTPEVAPTVGSTRACSIEPFGPFEGEIHERLVELDHERMVLAYTAVRGMPGFVTRATNRWSVEHVDGDRCRVVTSATLDLAGPMALAACVVRWQLGRAGARVLEELRHYAEVGDPHPRKVAALGAHPAPRDEDHGKPPRS